MNPEQVAAHYDVRVAEMFSARRARNIARPRQVAMYLAKTLTSLSYPESAAGSVAGTTRQ